MSLSALTRLPFERARGGGGKAPRVLLLACCLPTLLATYPLFLEVAAPGGGCSLLASPLTSPAYEPWPVADLLMWDDFLRKSRIVLTDLQFVRVRSGEMWLVDITGMSAADFLTPSFSEAAARSASLGGDGSGGGGGHSQGRPPPGSGDAANAAYGHLRQRTALLSLALAAALLAELGSVAGSDYVRSLLCHRSACDLGCIVGGGPLGGLPPSARRLLTEGSPHALQALDRLTAIVGEGGEIPLKLSALAVCPSPCCCGVLDTPWGELSRRRRRGRTLEGRTLEGRPLASRPLASRLLALEGRTLESRPPRSMDATASLLGSGRRVGSIIHTLRSMQGASGGGGGGRAEGGGFDGGFGAIGSTSGSSGNSGSRSNSGSSSSSSGSSGGGSSGGSRGGGGGGGGSGGGESDFDEQIRTDLDRCIVPNTESSIGQEDALSCFFDHGVVAGTRCEVSSNASHRALSSPCATQRALKAQQLPVPLTQRTSSPRFIHSVHSLPIRYNASPTACNSFSYPPHDSYPRRAIILQL